MKADPMLVVLAVDDQPDNLDLLCELLAAEPYTVVTAGDAEAALAEHRRYRPALAILDVEMPGVDGFELCRRLRSEHPECELPILFLTARCRQTEDVVHGLELGACDFITKPFDARELRARIRAALRSRSAHERGVAQAKAVMRRLARPADRAR